MVMQHNHLDRTIRDVTSIKKVKERVNSQLRLAQVRGGGGAEPATVGLRACLPSHACDPAAVCMRARHRLGASLSLSPRCAPLYLPLSPSISRADHVAAPRRQKEPQDWS